MITRRALFAAVAGLATCAIASSAWSERWPQRPVTIVVPFAAGGNTDGITRLAGQRPSEKLGQPFVLHNIGGTGGTIAGTTVSRARADGYTRNTPEQFAALIGSALKLWVDAAAIAGITSQ
jgi:tripartite-type tricarboxylate transporter receptor subunit TctC